MQMVALMILKVPAMVVQPKIESGHLPAASADHLGL